MPATEGYTPELLSLTIAVEMLWADRIIKGEGDPLATVKAVKNISCDTLENQGYKILPPSPDNHAIIQRAVAHHETFWTDVEEKVRKRLEQLREAGKG